MGRHSADPGAADGSPDAAPEHHDELGRRFVAGPTTDPLLLDALAGDPRSGSARGSAPRSAPIRQVSPPGAQEFRTPTPSLVRDAPPTASAATAQPARTREVPDPPWAPRPVVRYDDAPFSGPVALPDPPEVDLARRTDVVEAQVRPAHAPLPALVEDPPRSPAAAVAAAPDLEPSSPDADGEQERIGLSVRTLLLSLGVGVGVAVALSVVAVLPI